MHLASEMTTTSQMLNEHWMLGHAYVIPGLMVVSFFLILFFGKRLPKRGAEIGIPAISAAFVMACVAVVQWIQHVDESLAGEHGSALAHVGRSLVMHGGGEMPVQPITQQWVWWQNGLMKFTAGIQIDGIAVMMLFVVTFISLLVHIYSTAYMEHDTRYTYFYAALSLFTGSMLILVVANNSLMLLTGDRKSTRLNSSH